MALPTGAGRPPPPSFLYGGRGNPRTHKFLLTVCDAPLHSYLDHTIVVLRRSPAPVASSSPSPRRRADGTHPRPQLDQEHKGRHQAKRVLNTEVSCIRYLIGWIVNKFDYINRVIETLPLLVYEGTWTHSPLSLLYIIMILRVHRIFLKLLRSPTNGTIFMI